MILIELTAAIDAAGTVQSFYVSTDRFVSSTVDTPANVAFDPRLIDPGTIGIHSFADGRTGGATKLETGEIVLANADGALDAWLNYSFDGRPVTIRVGADGSAYPSGFTTVLVGTIEAAEASWDKFILRLRDKQWRFHLPALAVLYAGNNILPNGLEGTATDLAGKPKPKVYGNVFNVSPAFCNTSKLTYEVGICNSIDAVYDSGLALTAGADFTTSTLLQAATPGAGTFITCLAEGYFRLGSPPVGQITADVTQGVAAANRTVAQLLKQLSLDAGFAIGEISGSDVTALNTVAPQVVGIWLFDTSTFQQAMDMLAASIGAWYGFDATGTLRMGQLLAPSGTPVAILYDYDILNSFQRRPPKDKGIPIWRIMLGYQKNWTVQTSGLAGAVSTPARAFLSQQYRFANTEDASIKNQWLLAGTDSTSTDKSANTLLTNALDALTESSRRLALYKVRRDIFDVPVSLDYFSANPFSLGSVVAIQLARFSMDTGRRFRLIGLSFALAAGTVTLTVWG